MAVPRKYRQIASNGGAGIEVQGLADFTRALKHGSDIAPAKMREANFDAAKTLVRGAKESARADSKVAAKAARSLRASRSAAYSAVSGGGPRWPFFYGAEFGAKRWKQFKSWRGNRWGGWDGGPGYFLHPTIRRKAPEIIKDWWRRVDEITAEAFPD